MFMIGLIVSLLYLPTFAVTHIQSSIFDLDHAKQDQDETLILLNTGKVLRIPKGSSPQLNLLINLKDKNQFFDFIVDEENFVIDLIPLNQFELPGITAKLIPAESLTYLPTTVSSISVARQYFYQARYHPKESQCFNRAMVWSYEWWRRHSLKSNKILIFFTRSYIRRYNFEWWFHISPYVHVMDNGKVVERVMDVKYTSGPTSFRNWTNIFMNQNQECSIIEKFSDYADHPYEGDCYLQRTTMYTYQPADLQMLEAWGYTKDDFNLTEVKQAYLEAMDEIITINEGAANE